MALSNGTGYTNLQKYITANQGNKLNNVINSGVSGVVDQGKKELDTQRNTFDTGLNADTSRLNDLSTGANNTFNLLKTNAGGINDQQVGQFQNAMNAHYTGPQGLENETALNNKVNNINQVSNLAGSQAGRGQLLKTFINSPNYTKNKENLDSLLLGNDVDSNLRKAKQQGQQLSNNINSNIAGAHSRANEADVNAQNTGKQLKTNTQQVGTDLTTNLLDRAKTLQAGSDKFNSLIQHQNLTDLKPYGFNPTETDQNGYLVHPEYLYDAGRAQATSKEFGYGNDYYSNLITPNYAKNINPAGVASNEQRAQAGALTKLLNDPTYQAYTTGDKYVAPTVGINQARADQLVNDKYNQFYSNTPISQLAQHQGFDPLTGLIKNYADSGNAGALNGDMTLSQLYNTYNQPNVLQDSPVRQDVNRMSDLLKYYFGQNNAKSFGE